jgi:7-carboxy-7-deazaguanine synthase
MHFDAIMDAISTHQTPYVCVTGGEPLAQKRCAELLVRLCDEGYAVSLETSGAVDIGLADTRVSRVMDLKTPDSGEQHRNLWTNLEQLTPNDQVKFVICSRQDYDWARAQVKGRNLADRCEVLFSPSWGQVDHTELAEWILADRLPVRYQLQLHKLLWGDVAGK